jgi:argininosuccinate lyase
MSKPLWKKDQDVDPWVIRFTVGEDYRWDQILLPYDIKATVAHVHGLRDIEIVTAEETESVERALDKLLDDYRAGLVVVNQEDEDCHTVIENYLTETLGDVGKKVHTGRSRNDQVLAALRLYLRDELGQIAEATGVLCTNLVEQGSEKDDWVLPGYTHTRQAMPSSVGAWALGFAELLVHDVEGLIHSRNRINVSPLGSAAGYGVPFLQMPRETVARELGFEGVQQHVTSAQLSRGKFELEIVHALVQLSLTLNRLAADLILYSSAEFGFVTLAQKHTTGSSIMPQKQNPDVLELIRASYHRILAEMSLLSSLAAGLTSGYHRDLQLAKEAVMRAVSVSADCVTAMSSMLAEITFDRDRMESAMRADTLATHEALKMTLSGTAFRDAYRSTAAGADSKMTATEALEAYVSEGYPGKSDAEPLKSRIRDALESL